MLYSCLGWLVILATAVYWLAAGLMANGLLDLFCKCGFVSFSQQLPIITVTSDNHYSVVYERMPFDAPHKRDSLLRYMHPILEIKLWFGYLISNRLEEWIDVSWHGCPEVDFIENFWLGGNTGNKSVHERHLANLWTDYQTWKSIWNLRIAWLANIRFKGIIWRKSVNTFSNETGRKVLKLAELRSGLMRCPWLISLS